MTIIEQIKAEVENALHILGSGYSEMEMGQISAYGHILSFLSTLELEKPMNQEGLEEEIKSFTEELECGAKNIYCSMFGKEGNFDKFSWKDIETIIKDAARHFYDLGCIRTAEKADEIEYNRQRAEESVCKDLEKEIDFQTFSKEMGAVFALPKERTENTEEEPLRWEYEIARHFAKWGAKHLADDSKTSPNDLEEASSKFATYTAPNGLSVEFIEKKLSFQEGAKWQKEQDTREMIMSDGSYFQKCYELGKKDILSKFTKEHLEGLKWIERTGISTQPVPYHKYCKDLYKVLEEILKEKYDTQGDTSI